MAKKKNKSSSTGNSNQFFNILLLVVTAVFVLIFLYYIHKVYSLRKSASLSAAPVPVPQGPQVRNMYVPQEKGVRTGKKKVFMTNKGPRLYEVNEMGQPLPRAA